MNDIYLFSGILVLVLVAVDLLWTSIWVDGGGGLLSRRMGKGFWYLLRKISRDNSKILRLAGPLILSLTLVMWILLLWAGWTLVFSADAGAVLLSQKNTPITSWTERIYFVGFTLFTLGIGDYIPKKGFWQIMTTIATGSGMLFITLSVSYVVSVVSGVVQKRTFAKSITGQGSDWVSIVKRSWDGSSFNNIDLFLKDQSSQLTALTQQHKAYPILHYYHTQDKGQSSAVAVALFDEALTVYEYGVDEKFKPNQIWIQEARSSVADYLDTLHSVFFKSAPSTPPPMDLDPLREKGIPVKSPQEFNIFLSELVERREKLLGLVEADAWHWPSNEQQDSHGG
ncbi:ion channel [Bacillus salacetis]|uniref:ion channel n=1 Tax=Bacillus salacetis TaxID=2315464 RepID=UPI001F0B99FB|nr:ion channel [Bacillus salacetis]